MFYSEFRREAERGEMWSFLLILVDLSCSLLGQLEDLNRFIGAARQKGYIYTSI